MAAFMARACILPTMSISYPNPNPNNLRSGRSHSVDAYYIKRAVELADKSAGFSSPHPNFGCVIEAGRIVGEGYLYAQGTTAAEVQAVEAAGEWCRGATAYLNMECGDCHGERTAVSALVQAGVKRVVVGMRHPLKHLRGGAIQALRSEGIHVDVLGEDLQSDVAEEALKSCLLVNAPLVVRAASHVPYSVLKYAMTLDGKIATNKGHSVWISSNLSRCRVLELRGRSDAIIVGGNTVRNDNPRLTARQQGGHSPVRIVVSQSLDLPEIAHLWDTSEVHTIVATQKGARRSFQKYLASKGVEVIEFEILNPRDVMEYFYECGYLSVLWECGGTLAASAISSGVINKVYAFIAPKIIGGKGAPSPVGELGMVEMTQALNLHDVSYEQVGPDMLVSGFLQPIPDLTPIIPSFSELSKIDPSINPYESSIISFYKTWDPYGSFSNFSPHPIQMPDEGGHYTTWSSVEHYYQAHKFYGVQDPLAQECFEAIKSAKSPEEAARIGRKMQRRRPDLVRSDWEAAKIDIMYSALKCKFSIYPHLNSMLLSTVGSILVEGSPHDFFWGGGRDGEGLNYLGRLLMQLRSEFVGESSSHTDNPDEN
ncbi:riboflavin biosynthesis protein PYRR, chloroplastic-like [Chenopodium quinoa]|uniref:riboflavin biosynthesis protein PYRR, chloroplastic-like n=1 Tax=Chenopodium quinoa TaxID=63459 RepID=UPI000B77A7DD|nr:riboflavin biosynthesis protein PYRR, chloroplastic-like [Chenopodium quinoa]